MAMNSQQESLINFLMLIIDLGDQRVHVYNWWLFQIMTRPLVNLEIQESIDRINLN